MPSNKNNQKIYLTSKYVCKYISEEWLIDGKSTREYGKIYGVHKNTIEKIMEKDGYNLPLYTLSIICFNKGVKLSDFFKLVENKYGGKLNDSFILK
ncbi:hypothetical protein KFZ70_09105 [Tamlana fucoidanivorans]|uniref:Uncharacterized protein n=1 Tax=Allotamlana fucoidanivorans TaxID=2583814 RepID=A0A5C4SQL7_9FLAO|nr:hypothetical protein [Tamlana fucoidanivorans]TNJ46085.1 hypothetical protein FGF67_03580 [Tamlana fucoidanivorans]